MVDQTDHIDGDGLGPDAEHLDGAGDDSPETLTQKMRSFGAKIWPYLAGAAGAVAYFVSDLFATGVDQVVGLVLLALIWLWINGYALSVLAGIIVRFVDSLVGVRLWTWGYNISVMRPTKKRPNLGTGFIHNRPRKWVSEIIVAAVVAVGYSFVNQVWLAEPSESGSTSVIGLLLDWRAHWDMIQVAGGVLLGLIIAPYVGMLFRQLVILTTFNDFIHFENRPYIGAVIRGVGNLIERLNQWGNLDNRLTEEEVAANEHAMSLERAVWAPVAIVLNIGLSIMRFFFTPGRRVLWYLPATRWFVIVFMLVAIFWMRELSGTAYVLIVNSSLYVPIILLGFGTVWAVYRVFRWATTRFAPAWGGEIVGVLVASICAVFVIKGADEVDYFTHLWHQHQELEIVRVTRATMPVTEDPRLFALGSIRAGMTSINEFGVESFSNPAYVLIGDDVRWTALIEDMHWSHRWFNPETRLYNLPATSTGITLGVAEGQRIDDVCFDATQFGYSGRNVFNSAHRSLPTEKLFTHEPHEMKLMQNDSGEWVQVISINQFVSAPLRRKAFGGVVIIPQCGDVQHVWLQDTWVNTVAPAFAAAIDSTLPSGVHRELFGLGTYVSPEQIAAGEYPFLLGNNLIAEATARRIAESFRFHTDVFAPFSNTRTGDVRIPDRGTDRNAMPHMGEWSGMPGSENVPAHPESRVYANLILQPYGRDTSAQDPEDPNNQGSTDGEGSNRLAFELWIPGDGASFDGKPIVYMLDAKLEGMDAQLGVTEVAAQVRGLLPEFAWDDFEVVEATSHKRMLGGEVRSMMLARVVPIRGSGALVLSNDPKIMVFDPVYRQAHELSIPDGSQAEWDEEILAAFGKRWGVESTEVVENGG